MLEDTMGAICYAADILKHVRDRQEHDQRLHPVLQKLWLDGTTLNQKKKRNRVCGLQSLQNGHRARHEHCKSNTAAASAYMHGSAPSYGCGHLPYKVYATAGHNNHATDSNAEREK